MIVADLVYQRFEVAVHRNAFREPAVGMGSAEVVRRARRSDA